MGLSRRTRLIKNIVADLNQMNRFTDLRLSKFSESEIDQGFKFPSFGIFLFRHLSYRHQAIE